MDKPDCQYGADCYRKNPDHLEKYAHPSKPSDANVPQSDQQVNEPGSGDGGSSFAHKRLWKGCTTAEQLEDVKRCKRPPTPEKDDGNADADDSKHEYHGMTRQRYRLPEVPMDVGMMSDLYDPQIEYSKREEYKELCREPKDFIRHKFLVTMPPCFDSLWEFCTEEAAKTNVKPECVFEGLGLSLVGPFEVLAGKFKEAVIYEPGDYLRHWRFFYDPPEFQTVLVKKGSGLHYGYWRDEPDNTDGLTACNDVKKGCEFKIVGQNVFDAIIHFIDENVSVTPFNKKQIGDLRKKLEEWTTSKGIPLKANDKIKARNHLVVCKTFHKAGLVVPYDRKQDLGYRPLLESDAKLRQMLAKFNNLHFYNDKSQFQEAMRELQTVITAATLAVDECDFGTALELGLALFCHGEKNLHEVMKPLFFTGYSMLKRPQYIAIIKSHLDDRCEGINLDLLAKKG